MIAAPLPLSTCGVSAAAIRGRTSVANADEETRLGAPNSCASLETLMTHHSWKALPLIDSHAILALHAGIALSSFAHYRRKCNAGSGLQMRHGRPSCQGVCSSTTCLSIAVLPCPSWTYKRRSYETRSFICREEVLPSRAYGPPLVAVMPGGEGPTNQVQYNRFQRSRYNTGSSVISRRHGLPSLPSDTKW
jgi:hypothetical protein